MRREGPTRAGLAEVPPEAQRAHIQLAGTFEGVNDDRLGRTVTALASMVRVEPDAITVLQVKAGVAKAEVPVQVLRALRELLEANDARLRMLKTNPIILEMGFGRREEWVSEEGRYTLRPPQPAPPKPPEPIHIRIFWSLLVAALAGCISYAAAELVQIFWPTVSQPFLTVAPMVAAVEAGYSFQLLRHRRLFLDDIIKFRTVELLLLLLLIKAGTFIGQSPSEILAEIRAWPDAPSTIIDIETALGVVLCLVAWRTTTVVMNDLRRLGEPPERSRYYVSPFDSLTGHFFWGGGILLLLVGLSSVGQVVPDLGDRSVWTLIARLRQSTSPDMVLVLLAYFVLGLLMLGQVRLVLLRKQWQAQSLSVDIALGRRWLVASLSLLIGALLIAFLLPTGYTAGLLHILSVALAWIARILTYIGSLLIFLLGLFLAPLLALLFGAERQVQPENRVPRFQPPVAPPEAGGPPPEWLLLMRTILFWGLVAAAVIYVIVTYLRDHPELVAWVTGWRPLAFLRRLWAAIRRLWRRWGGAIQERLATLERRVPEGAPGISRPFRFLRLSALSPRERILYYYWSILKRAGRWGLPRRPAQTPREYRASLESHLSKVDDELGELTDAFVEARYSKHPVDAEAAEAIKRDWQAVRGSLRSLRRPPAPAREPDEDDQ